MNSNTILRHNASAVVSAKKDYSLLWFSLAFLIISGIAYGAYYYGHQAGYETGNQIGYTAGFRKGVQKEDEDQYRSAINDNPVSWKINIDEVLKGLRDKGDNHPNQAFRDSVNQVHQLLLAKVVERYGLSDQERNTVFQAYEAKKDEEATIYFKELQALQQTRRLPSQTFISLKSYEVANDFSVILADRSCSLVSTIMGFASIAAENKLVLKNSCNFIARELLKPLAQEMIDRGLVIDATESLTKIESQTRSLIAELAVSEDRLDELVNQTYIRTFNKGSRWFEFHSKANLSVRAQGSIKAGFDLQAYYKVRIDPSTKTFYVVLPRAKVLSRDISFEIVNDEDGYFINVTTEKRNQAFAQIRSQLEQTALRHGILKSAEDQALKLVRVLYSPVIYLPGISYEVKVQFEGDDA